MRRNAWLKRDLRCRSTAVRCVLHRIHERALYLVEHDDAQGQDEYGEAGGVAESGPAEFAHAEHAELERFHDAGERICLHEHLEARILDGAERVNHRGRVHPELHDKAQQECKVAVLGSEAAEQHAESEGECGDEQYEYRCEQCIQIRVYRGVGKNQIVRKNQEKEPHLDAETHEVARDGRKRHHEAREIHLAEHVRVFDEGAARLVQAFRKIRPEADAGEVEERLR